MMIPGRRIKLILGEPGVSKFTYNGILLDAKQDSVRFMYHYAVFLVPQVSLSTNLWLLLSFVTVNLLIIGHSFVAYSRM